MPKQDGAHIAADETNLIYQTIKAVYGLAGKEVPGLKLTLTNNIPFTRGLGSSAACRVGGVMIADKLLNADMDKQDITAIAANLEGHPENVAAAVYGGMTVAVKKAEKVFVKKIEVKKDLKCAVMTPAYTLGTQAARESLPDTVLFDDAVYNISRTAMVVACIASGDYAGLKEALNDRLHQPYRKGNIKG